MSAFKAGVGIDDATDTRRLDLSVVLCVLNGAEYIADQLSALAAQEASCSWELIVADNGSSDDTHEIAEGFAASFPVAMRVVDAGSVPGICHARNVGVMSSRGEGIAFCDCDDLVLPGWVQAAFDGLSGADLIGGLNRRMTDPIDAGSAVLNPGGIKTSRLGYAVQGCNFAVRREMYFKAGGFDESLPPYGMDDTEFSYRAGRAGARIRSCDEMQILFRETTGLRVLLKKAFRSGMAELFVWHRFPEVYAERLKLKSLVWELLIFPAEYARLALEGKIPSGRAAFREGVNRVARIAAVKKYGSGKKFPAPILLSQRDDPLRFEGVL